VNYYNTDGCGFISQGENLASVQKSEVRVTLLDENCSITVITSTVSCLYASSYMCIWDFRYCMGFVSLYLLQLVQCIPPDFPIRNDRSIEVKVRD